MDNTEMWVTAPVTSWNGEIWLYSKNTCVYNLLRIAAESKTTNVNSRSHRQCDSYHKALCSLWMTFWSYETLWQKPTKNPIFTEILLQQTKLIPVTVQLKKMKYTYFDKIHYVKWLTWQTIKHNAEIFTTWSKLHNIKGLIPPFGLFARASRTVIRDWIFMKHNEHWQPKEKGRLRALLKDPC
jgi:hypothetical protein